MKSKEQKKADERRKRACDKRRKDPHYDGKNYLYSNYEYFASNLYSERRELNRTSKHEYDIYISSLTTGQNSSNHDKYRSSLSTGQNSSNHDKFLSNLMMGRAH